MCHQIAPIESGFDSILLHRFENSPVSMPGYASLRGGLSKSGSLKLKGEIFIQLMEMMAEYHPF